MHGPEDRNVEPNARPSLLDRLMAGRRRDGAEQPSWTGIRRGIVAAAVWVPLVGFAAVAAASWPLAHRMDRRTAALETAVASIAEDRDRQSRLAGVFASPTLDARLSELRRHLPADVRLAACSFDVAEGLSFAIDTSDPDALRQAIRADPWFADVHDRGQTIGGNGVIRVVLTRAG